MSATVTTLQVLVKGYTRILSPLLPPSCRFSPTCSRYCYQALGKYGVRKGLIMTIKRLSRCHPWHPGGFDPVK